MIKKTVFPPQTERVGDFFMDKSFFPSKETLCKALIDEQDAIELYKKLACMTKDEETAHILDSIRKDEIEHFACLLKLCKRLYGSEPQLPEPKCPQVDSFQCALKAAAFAEVESFEFYKHTYVETYDAYAKKILFCAMHDEISHAVLLNLLLTKTLM